MWVTRYRRKILNLGVREYLETKLQEARKYYPDWEYIAIGIAEDHNTFAHGDSAQIRSQHGCRDVKEKHEQTIKPEVSFPQAGVL